MVQFIIVSLTPFHLAYSSEGGSTENRRLTTSMSSLYPLATWSTLILLESHG